MDISNTKKVHPKECAKNRKTRLPNLSLGNTEGQIKENQEWQIITWKDKKDVPTYLCICDAVVKEACVMTNIETGKMIMAGGGCVDKITNKKKGLTGTSIIREILEQDNLVLVRDGEYNEDDYQDLFTGLIAQKLLTKLNIWKYDKNKLIQLSLELGKYKNRFIDIIIKCNERLEEINMEEEKEEKERKRKEKEEKEKEENKQIMNKVVKQVVKKRDFCSICKKKYSKDFQWQQECTSCFELRHKNVLMCSGWDCENYLENTNKPFFRCLICSLKQIPNPCLI